MILSDDLPSSSSTSGGVSSDGQESSEETEVCLGFRKIDLGFGVGVDLVVIARGDEDGNEFTEYNICSSVFAPVASSKFIVDVGEDFFAKSLVLVCGVPQFSAHRTRPPALVLSRLNNCLDSWAFLLP